MITLSHADAHWARQLLDWVLPRAESDTLETKRVSGKMVGKALGGSRPAHLCFLSVLRARAPRSAFVIFRRG